MNTDTSFHLCTRHLQLSLRISEQGKLLFSRLGTRLHSADDAFAVSEAEWPLISTDFDTTGRWGNYSGEYALQLRWADGSQGCDLYPTEVTQGENSLTAKLSDSRHPEFVIITRLRAFPEEDIFTLSTTLENKGSGHILLIRAATAALPLRAGQYHLTTFRGGWSGENYLSEERLRCGNTLSVGSTTGIKTAQEGTPGFLLSLDTPAQENHGTCLLGALAWSGNYRLSFKHSSYGHLFLSMGHDFEHSPYTLCPGKSITLPTAVLAFSKSGSGTASRNMHRYLRRHILPHGTEYRRTLLNSWEGVHFDVHDHTVRQLAEHTARLGAELFVLDDGWFGQRNDDTSSLGDWEPNPDKLPQGLQGPAAHAAACGIGFGIWIEPEMVSPKSKLYARHPELAIALSGITPREERRQLVLDVSNPALDLTAPLRRILRNTPGISYVKWDCNRKISDPGSAHLPPQLQGNLYFDYISRYYEQMQELRREFPDVTFQCCSAGGGRLDFGAAAYHEEFWLSDNTDACDRLRMQWAASFFFPANAIGCHFTASPNCYTHRDTSLKFRFDTALAGRLGLELDPRTLTEEEMREIRSRVELAKTLRPIIQLGELYRLLSPYSGPDCALLYVHGGDALLLAYTTQRVYTNQHTRIPLCGLSPTANYRIEELAPDNTGYHCPLQGRTLGGDALLTDGIPIHWTHPQQSCVLKFTI